MTLGRLLIYKVLTNILGALTASLPAGDSTGIPMTTADCDTPFLLFIGQHYSDRSASELTSQGRLRIHWETDVRTALDLLPAGKFDAIILDAGLAPQSIHEIRLKSSALLLMLADTPDACFEAVRAGADDFILKPCHSDELLVRTQSLLERRRGSGPCWLQFGPLTINVRAHEASLNGCFLDLTHSELTILKCLVAVPFKTVTRDELALALYQRESSPYERSIDVHISNLRRKIEAVGGIRIRSVRGVGYLLATDILRVVDAARAS